jgi:tRNA(Ile)-lysidine synthase
MLPVKRFTDFIEQNKLFKSNNKVLAAVSGGMDSVLLVHLLHSAGISFGIAHCNFQLRGHESTRDYLFCQNLAQQFDVPFHSTSFDTLNYAASQKISTQMAARNLRYQWFEQVRQELGYTVTALAHHQNDAIETILLNLTRGTGIAGLHGILAANGRVVRPMLFLNRDEIQNIIAENGIEYVEDSSNTSAKYARNKIRLEVVPKLKELNPGLEHTFQNNLERFREFELLLTQYVDKLKKDLFVVTGDEITLPLAAIKKLEPKRLLLFHLLQQFGVNETIVDDLISSLDKHSGRVFETSDYRLYIDRDELIITKTDWPVYRPIFMNVDDKTIHYGSYKLSVLHDDSALIVKDNPMAVSVDTALLIFPLTIRTWLQGDYFYPLGMKTRKKLSDFFINQKIPLHQKNEIPLIVNGNGELIWIGGYRLDERYKINGNTKKVTIFELYK